jgi:hypothetical protein
MFNAEGKKQKALLYTCLQSDKHHKKKPGRDKRVGKNLLGKLLDENSIQDNSSQMTPGLTISFSSTFDT